MIFCGEKVPTPGGICETRFNDWNATHPLCECDDCAESPVHVSYCKHNQTGGFIQMDLEEFRWTMFSPVNEDAWRWFIKEAVCNVIEADSMHLFDQSRTVLTDRTMKLSTWRSYRAPH